MKTSLFCLRGFGLAAALTALTTSAQIQPLPSSVGDPSTNRSAPIPTDQLGAVAGKQYQGDGLSVTATPEGARLRCVFQRLEGEVTPEGLWLTSTAEGGTGERFRVVASAVGRVPEPRRSGGSTERRQTSERQAAALCRDAATEPRLMGLLPRTGKVAIADQVARFIRPGLTEEYSVSVDGVRQDFVVAERPAGAGDLRVELALSGARAEVAAYGARLTLEGSGRGLAYSRLRAVDGMGKELVARLEVLSADRLAVRVADANATYPVRIDPTFSDADWVSLNPDMSGADGDVQAIVVDGSGKVYVGGYFTVIGTVVANGIAMWDGSTWSTLGSGMGGQYPYVKALAVNGTNLYAGGYFATAGGIPANHIAKWNGSAWSALGEGMEGTVCALAVSATNLYAGGEFTRAGGVPANYIARWDGHAWSALGEGMGGTSYVWVQALAVSGGYLYAGGYFTTAGGMPANYIAKWNGNTWSALGEGMSDEVHALVVSGINLYAGGSFIRATNSGGVSVTVNSIAKWDGHAWSALGSGVDSGPVYALAVSGTDLYAGGGIYGPGGYGIAKWNGRGWSDPGSAMNSSVHALAVSGTDLYVGGDFTTAGGVPANRIARWSISAWSALGSGIDGLVRALAVIGTDLYAGGTFIKAGGVPATNIAKWDGSAWSALGSGTDGNVYALAVIGTDLYAGGEFTHAGGVQASNIAKWNGTAWSALGSGMDYDVHALAVSGTDLYVGGDFRTAGGIRATSIAKWNGHAWSALGLGMYYVSALAVSGNDLYVGGLFTNAGGVWATNLAKWNGSAWSAVGSGINGWVAALAVSGANLYAGGHFTKAGGVWATNIAKWDGGAWSAVGSGISGLDCYVYALAVSGNNLYAGGLFTNAGGVPATNIAKWNGSAWSAVGSGMNWDVWALAVIGTNLYAGGWFTTVDGILANHIARWNDGGWSAMGEGMNYKMYAVAVKGNSLYAGGGVYLQPGAFIGRIAEWSGNVWSAWSVLGSGVWSAWSAWGPGGGSYYPAVYALAVSGSNLYAGGVFTNAGGVPANSIAKWNGSVWLALGSGMDGPVYALAARGTDLYAGGDFSTAGGVTASNIAKWNGSAWSALGSGMNAPVHALAVSGINLYAGGIFTTAGGELAAKIAKWNGSAWSALGSGMTGISSASYYPGVCALAVSGANLYAGGWFTNAGGVPATNIAKWNGTAWSALGSGMDNTISALAVSGTDLYAGGGFTIAGGVSANRIARWNGSTWSALGSGINNHALGSWATNHVFALAADGLGHLFVGGDFSLAGTKVSPFIAQANLSSITPAPDLAVSSHTNLQVVASPTVTLAGSASDAGQGDSGIAWVTVNGVRATNDTAVGSAAANWSRVVRLVAGTNTIVVVAADTLGHSTTNVIRIVLDNLRPTLAITAPRAGQRWSNAVFTVKGTIKDNLRVAEVWCQTNGVWGLASLGSGGTNWSIDVALVPGSNTVRACAVDGAGTRSVTNSVSFVYVVSDRLVVRATGPCALSPNYSNAVLEVGKSYAITATAGLGQVLSNWVGGVAGNAVILGNTPRLTFVMQSNLVLQANIIPNRFIPVKGTYNGLFAETERAHESSGFLTLTLTDRRSCSGSLRRGMNSWPFSGQFDLAGATLLAVTRPGTNAWVLRMALDFAAEQLTGTVSNGLSGGWVADLRAGRAAFDTRTNPATQYAGKYTFIIPSSEDDDSVPQGYGYGTISLDAGGRATLSGSLADGTNFSQMVALSKDGEMPLYASLYGGRGSVWSWLAFDSSQPSRGLEGWLSWIRPAQPTARFYPAGFSNVTMAVGSRYTPPPRATNRVIQMTNGVVMFEGGNLVAPFTNAILLTASNRVSNLSSNKLSVTLTLSSGLFNGSATAPRTSRSVLFKGALLQQEDSGYGYFLGTNQSGAVLMERGP